GLHARAFHAHASTDGVNRRIAGIHGDFGAVTRITGRAFDGDDAVIDFRHVLFEQTHEKTRVRPRHHDLRSTRGTLHFQNERRDAVFHAVCLSRHLFFVWNHGFRAAEINDDVVALETANVAAQDLAGTVFELFVNLGPFRIPHFLHDDLLGGLSGDPAEM